MKQASLALVAISSVASAFQTCTVPFGGPGIDDSEAVRTLLPKCSSNAEIIFTSCTTYNISTPINFGTLSNVTVSILGNLNLPSSISYVQGLVNATASKSLYWFTFKVSCVRRSARSEAKTMITGYECNSARQPESCRGLCVSSWRAMVDGRAIRMSTLHPIIVNYPHMLTFAGASRSHPLEDFR